ncbi:lactate utilization protein [Aeoliella sp. ICT_H6.2]|uniref:Lactate utilization protein n=1 Tax=Aeoliella straminimaris TaxID=2954799 RepID=A0A9X2F4Y7_9BACT|nr:lactate utilization protein B [Aeoliella straminimaris]MCO6042290.1 lactate utilization protein [Aeoliella straminimaris]
MSHATAAAEFIADAERTKWHDETIFFVRKKRDLAAASVPEWELLRETASQIKRHTLSRLDEYLEQFEANAIRHGIKVHWARNGKEHNEIVLGLLKERDVNLLVKSKSMLTEECGLNPFLEAAGIEVVDTDLGERIVQMRHEHPSHIVLPAIHIKKQEVGQLFHDQLGTEAGASDPDYLTEAARNHLRDKLISAGAGLTGVNFGIAETGGIVVCTNEGNADLGTALPPLHIASMGLEKLIPRLDHLGVFLRLLARSATGQPITAYSSHFHTPREGQEMHIVLVDNGRSGMMGQSEFNRALNCIRCGACLNTCPVYRRSGGHSYHATVAGPIGSVINPARDPEKFESLPFACSLCGSCTEVCPVKIPLHHQLLAMRHELGKRHLLPMAKTVPMKVAGAVLRRPWLYRTMGKLGRVSLRWLPRFLIYNPLNVWGRQRDLPEAPKESFRQAYKKRAPQARSDQEKSN